jgi:hypothetical protein
LLCLVCMRPQFEERRCQAERWRAARTSRRYLSRRMRPVAVRPRKPHQRVASCPGQRRVGPRVAHSVALAHDGGGADLHRLVAGTSQRSLSRCMRPLGRRDHASRTDQQVAQTLAFQRVCGSSLGFMLCNTTAQPRTKRKRVAQRGRAATKPVECSPSPRMSMWPRPLFMPLPCVRMKKAWQKNKNLRTCNAELGVFCPPLPLLEL